MQKIFNPTKYVLTFKAKGVSVFVTDIHRDVYKELEALFVIDKGEFKQYFPETAYNRALQRGLKFYKNSRQVDLYKKGFKTFRKNFELFFRNEIKGKKQISKTVLQDFFQYTIKLCKDYTKMNVEYTDAAYKEQGKNKIIKNNLKKVMLFKDEVRTFMNTVLFEPDGYSSQIFKILERQFGVRSSVLENFTQQELVNLFSSKVVNKSVAAKRQQAFVSVWNIRKPIEGLTAKNIIQKFRAVAIKSDSVKGQVANSGKVIGKVKIIAVDYGSLAKLNQEIGKMSKGDILVAETTAPELILACKKAAAIVTDLGGLMSHAAIVSRELNIPCIVGTKIATKVFKDGDIIEVDANKGTVKLIKR